jgi:hypothetical protein
MQHRIVAVAEEAMAVDGVEFLSFDVDRLLRGLTLSALFPNLKFPDKYGFHVSVGVDSDEGEMVIKVGLKSNRVSISRFMLQVDLNPDQPQTLLSDFLTTPHLNRETLLAILRVMKILINHNPAINAHELYTKDDAFKLSVTSFLVLHPSTKGEKAEARELFEQGDVRQPIRTLLEQYGKEMSPSVSEQPRRRQSAPPRLS